MSVRVMSKVWEQAPYSEGTLLVLLALADWSDDDGLCWPKISQIAKKARLTESGVKFCLKRLGIDRAIFVEQESEGPGKPRKYRIGVQYLNPYSVQGVQPTEPNGVSDAVQKGSSKRMRNKEEPSLNHQEQNPPGKILCSRCGGTGSRNIRVDARVYCDCPIGVALQKSEKHMHFAKALGR